MFSIYHQDSGQILLNTVFQILFNKGQFILGTKTGQH